MHVRRNPLSNVSIVKSFNLLNKSIPLGSSFEEIKSSTMNSISRRARTPASNERRSSLRKTFWISLNKLTFGFLCDACPARSRISFFKDSITLFLGNCSSVLPKNLLIARSISLAFRVFSTKVILFRFELLDSASLQIGSRVLMISSRSIPCSPLPIRA